MNIHKQNLYYLITRLIGKNAIDFIIAIGSIVSFLLFAIFKALIPPFYINEYLKQIIRIGLASLPVVGLTAFFTGGGLLKGVACQPRALVEGNSSPVKGGESLALFRAKSRGLLRPCFW